MARARLLKPRFFTDEDLLDLPIPTRLLFAGLWTLADKEGRLEDRPKRIKIELFPCDDIDINEALDALNDKGLLIRYQVDGQRYIEIPGFKRHQHIHHKEPPSVIPGLPQSDPSPTPVRPQSDPPEAEALIRSLNRKPLAEAEAEDPQPLPKLNIFSLYEQHIGIFDSWLGQQMAAAEEEYPPECIEHAFQEASRLNKRSWGYVEAILKSHKASGSCYDAKGELPGERDPELEWIERRYREGKARLQEVTDAN